MLVQPTFSFSMSSFWPLTGHNTFLIYLLIEFVFIILEFLVFILHYNQLIGQEGRVFANGLGDLDSIPGCVIPKTLKMVLDTSLLNTQQYKVCIKGKVDQFRERSSTLSYTSV